MAGRQDVEQVGMEAVLLGVAKFLSDSHKMEVAYDKTVKRFRAASSQFVAGKQATDAYTAGMRAAAAQTAQTSKAVGSRLANSLSAAAGGAGTLISALSGPMGLVVGMGAVVIAGRAVNKALEKVGQIMAQVAQAAFDLLKETATIPGVMQAFSNAIAGTDLSLMRLREGARGTIADMDLMRQTNLALAGTQGELKTAFADAIPKFLEIARAASRATGEDVNYMFNSLTRGVKRNSPLIVDNALVMLSAADAHERYAESVGKSVDELTDEEQRLAIIRRVLEQGDVIVRQYGSGVKTAAENLATIRAQTKNLTDTIGLAFQPAFTTATDAVARFVTWLTEAVQEGGKLYPTLIRLGAIASILADAFSAAVNVTIDFINRFEGTLIQGMSDTSSNMLHWGAEIVASLAEGMVQAAHTVLTVAADAIGQMITYWFAPGSPPKVAPKLDQWGAAAMVEYLKGFTKADYGILEKVQPLLQKILSPEAFAKLNQKLMAGGIGTGFFAKIAQTAGVYGQQIAKLAKLQFDLAKATTAMDEANKRYEASQLKVSRLTGEYNDMLRAGASDAELAAKLAEIRASEEEQAAAAQAKAKAETDTTDLQERLSLQESLVKQLMNTVEAQEASAKTASTVAKATKDAAKSISDLVVGLTPGGGLDIAGRMTAAIDEMKLKLKEKFTGIFQPLIDAWHEIEGLIFGYTEDGVPVEGIIDSFKSMQRDISFALDEINRKLGVFSRVAKIIFAMTVPGAVVMTIAHFGDLKAYISDELIPNLQELIGWIFGGPNDTDSLYHALQSVADKVVELYETIFPTFKEYIQDKIFKFLENFNLLYVEPIATAFHSWARSIKDIVQGWRDLKKEASGAAKDMNPFIGHSPSPLERGIVGATRALHQFAPALVSATSAAQPSLSPSAEQARPSVTSYSSTSNAFRVGPNYISNGMDQAMLEATVRRIIRQEMGAPA